MSFNLESARRAIEEVQDLRLPIAVRNLIKQFEKACDYIENLEKEALDNQQHLNTIEKRMWNGNS